MEALKGVRILDMTHVQAGHGTPLAAEAEDSLAGHGAQG